MRVMAARTCNCRIDAAGMANSLLDVQISVSHYHLQRGKNSCEHQEGNTSHHKFAHLPRTTCTLGGSNFCFWLELLGYKTAAHKNVCMPGRLECTTGIPTRGLRARLRHNMIRVAVAGYTCTGMDSR